MYTVCLNLTYCTLLHTTVFISCNQAELRGASIEQLKQRDSPLCDANERRVLSTVLGLCCLALRAQQTTLEATETELFGRRVASAPTVNSSASSSSSSSSDKPKSKLQQATEAVRAGRAGFEALAAAETLKVKVRSIVKTVQTQSYAVLIRLRQR
jgi:Rubisco LSMT substrate-binding